MFVLIDKLFGFWRTFESREEALESVLANDVMLVVEGEVDHELIDLVLEALQDECFPEQVFIEQTEFEADYEEEGLEEDIWLPPLVGDDWLSTCDDDW